MRLTAEQAEQLRSEHEMMLRTLEQLRADAIRMTQTGEMIPLDYLEDCLIAVYQGYIVGEAHKHLIGLKKIPKNILTRFVVQSYFHLMIRFHTNDDLLNVLRHRISQSNSMKVAAEIGIAPSTLSDVVSGRRPVSVRIARWLLAKEVEPVRVLREIA